ncbi:MAG: ATP-binding cassette domain-containing protein [Acidobacteriota bacterium]
MSIVLSEVSKRFGNHVVVDRVGLEILDGELFVLLGASGSGKSTILRMIAGLSFPDEGRIVIHGTDMTYAPVQQRGIGFVFQNYSIFSHMTVAQNIEFGLRIRGIARPSRIRRVEELLEMAGLAGLGNRMPGQLSGGQQQRVALARALAHEPKVLLLDEPFGALDVKIRGHLRRTLREVQKRLNVTTILVTHDQEEAFELGDRIGVLERGRLQGSGHPEELYRCPRSDFVATFLGGGNLLSGQAVDPSGLFGAVLPVPEEHRKDEGQRVHLFFRPEHLCLEKERPRDGRPVLGRGEVIEQVFSGSIRRVRVRVPRLPGCRQLAPRPNFGQEDWILEGELRSDLPLESLEHWVSLRQWSFLAPPRPRLLVFDNKASEGIEHLRTAAWLASRIDASVTVLRNRKEHESDQKARSEVQTRLTEAGLRGAAVLLPQGKSSEVLIREQAGNIYNFLLLSRPKQEAKLSDLGITRMLTRILEKAEMPLLIVSGPFRPIRRILVCTAAGEPGKNDIKLGAWVARPIGAAVTLLHVLAPHTDNPAARRHISDASSTLASLDIQVETKLLESTSPVEAILNQASSGDFDLLIMGGHGPHSSSFFRPEDVTLQVLKRVNRPVLVVPAQEEV